MIKNVNICTYIVNNFIYFSDNEGTSDLDTITDEYSATAEVKPFIVDSSTNSLTENDIFLSSTSLPSIRKLRKKRSLTSEYVVELMVVADKKMAEYHGKELHNYILTLMSIVSIRNHCARVINNIMCYR